eukprot:TRINITY_DN2514_c0_g2_i1.p1 TRINITY_DN2514_c0_g2~~TRINITY_DN2514_c0_g2_i1.p1  ORF type:complete len:249 (+),score=89.91 TRINITY_DN2514_c0_g2_i1:108-854(+)
MEKRHNYVRKVAETANGLYLDSNTNLPSVSGLILAGLADFKTELSQSDLFDNRLKAVIIKIVDVQYGGDNGFNQAIELSADALSNVKLVQEKKLISEFFEEIAKDTGKYCYGIKDTLTALDMGASKQLIVWDNLDHVRHVCRSKETGDEVIKYLTPTQESDIENFRDAEGKELEMVESMPVTEWLAQNYKNFGTEMAFVTDRSQEGTQYCQGFGGIGCLLRYRVDFAEIAGDYAFDSDDNSFDEDAFI